MSRYDILMRLHGEISLVIANLNEEEADDNVKTLNQLSNEGEVYYKQLTLEEKGSKASVQQFTHNPVSAITHHDTLS
ncbi:hypothetical protein H8S90_08740 [Olivibacter sp. SDN3]|uniref:hypothetical protein n=1 Tax=Olivibacter sp. SDN3 TaxID=2764720 RepID=UPI001650FB13|nr:hypothetical protein [Olivibacter sp. SDN3]QNL51641.1 hypothetical protein H8S90_08740 [Olivibacter sp. SDN3]